MQELLIIRKKEVDRLLNEFSYLVIEKINDKKISFEEGITYDYFHANGIKYIIFKKTGLRFFKNLIEHETEETLLLAFDSYDPN